MEFDEMLKELFEKRKSYKHLQNNGYIPVSQSIVNMDFASLYPNVMKSFDDEKFIKEQKRINREKKLKRILGEDI